MRGNCPICDQREADGDPDHACQTPDIQAHIQKLKEYRDHVTEKILDRDVRIAELIKAIAFIGQTVHQGYHTDIPGTFKECPRTVCDHIAKLL